MYALQALFEVYNEIPFSAKCQCMRPSQRAPDQMRDIKITRNFTKHAEGSVLIEFGHTKVICTASVIPGVPKFLEETSGGWVTAEYGMLPRSTGERMHREAARGKQGGRTQEIQRLIGRSLRAAVDLIALSEHTIIIDCDVIQAEGGTRTASITGGCIALYDAIDFLRKKEMITANPFKQFVAAISVGMFQSTPILDLDINEDVNAETDMNVVMTEAGGFIEIQGTAEKKAFERKDLDILVDLAKKGITQLILRQKQSLGLA